MQITKAELLREVVKRLRAGKLFHAIVLEGDEAEKTAIEISAACVCSSQEKPCGECLPCKKAFAKSHPDIHISVPVGASKAIPIEEIRFIREDTYIKPNEADRKVYILLSADRMNESAQNALLKALEEPIQDILFILVCEKSTSLLPTILSRSFVYDLGTHEEEPNEEADLLSEEIINALALKNEMELLTLSSKLISDKELFAAVLKNLEYAFYRVCVSISVSKILEGTSEKLCNVLTFARASKLYDITADTKDKLNKNANHALLVTSYFSRIYSARYGLV